MSNMTKHDIDCRALEDSLTLAYGTMGLKVPTSIILVSSSTLVPRFSGRVVFQLDWFMYICEIDPINYDETICRVNAIPRQRAIEGRVRIYVF